jgi:hypothetical protein
VIDPPTAVNETPRNPFEVFLLVAVAAGGVSLLFGARPGSVEAIAPPALVTAWGVVLVIGGSLSLAGVLRRGDNAKIVQQIGLALVAAACPLYTLALLLSVGLTATIPALYTTALALASVVKYRQIQRDIDQVITFTKAHAETVARDDFKKEHPK